LTSFSIQSFGCRVNQAEAFTWTERFQDQGLVYEEDPLRSDIVVVNTCTLTRMADRDVRSFLNRVSRENPEARLVVTGCYAEGRQEEMRTDPRVWKVVSNQDKGSLPERILSPVGAGKTAEKRAYRSRALVKVQDGCDFRCSFCIIPSVRGKSVSSDEREILSRIRKYTEHGFREVVLTGIHLCSYGLDRRPQTSLLNLLRECENIEALGRIRLSSLDPRFLDRPLVGHLTSSAKVCPHFHLSLQHGSDDVLSGMGRRIDTAQYRALLQEIRHRSPEASLGADIIVGFPGEKEKDFAVMLRFLEESPLTYFHVFPYSPRPGTPAAEWERVEEKAKKARAARLRRLSAKKNFLFRRKFAGRIMEGIVVKKSDQGAAILTSNYISVRVPSCPAGAGEEVRVRVTEVAPEETRGRVVP